MEIKEALRCGAESVRVVRSAGGYAAKTGGGTLLEVNPIEFDGFTFRS